MNQYFGVNMATYIAKANILIWRHFINSFLFMSFHLANNKVGYKSTLGFILTAFNKLLLAV